VVPLIYPLKLTSVYEVGIWIRWDQPMADVEWDYVTVIHMIALKTYRVIELTR
jgi:hypothetical protein